MHINLLVNEKNIGKNQRAAAQEYQKRLTPYCEVQWVLSGDKDLRKARLGLSSDKVSGKKELGLQGGRASDKTGGADKRVALFLTQGVSSVSSERFANQLNDWQGCGKSNIDIYIGYDASDMESLKSIYLQAFEVFSLSRLSLKNETCLVLMLEQIYRGYTILQGKTYHK